jgi:CubicO group peptidase (beta-lactamase class C family)
MRALRRGVVNAARLGGSVEAAVMLGNWKAPAIVASEPAGERRFSRAWSLSKVFTAVALLRELGWGAKPGKALTPQLEAALAGAITRSENCRQRRIVLELQRVAGGTPEAGRAAVAEALSLGGVRARLDGEARPPEPVCVQFLKTQSELQDPLAPSLLLGTSAWRIADAVRFVHALQVGRYGKAVGERVLSLMRRPKAVSREAPASDFTAAVNWGAGRVLGGFVPAYKAGWGGALQGRFVAGQVASVRLPAGGMGAVAVMFHPHEQPPKDDPGRTNAPAAIEAVMAALASEFGS